jgi:hypothetical protein
LRKFPSFASILHRLGACAPLEIPRPGQNFPPLLFRFIRRGLGEYFQWENHFRWLQQHQNGSRFSAACFLFPNFCFCLDVNFNFLLSRFLLLN